MASEQTQTPELAGAVPSPVELARSLIRCPSVTGQDAGALGVIQAVLERAGFACHRLVMREPGTADVENLYARLGASPPHLCFAGHSDVVPAGDAGLWRHPPFAAVVEDDVLYGRGAVDMKGAIACYLAAACDHAALGSLNGSLSVLITGDEEGPSINGTRKVLDWLKERGELPDACLVGEPTSARKVGDQIKIGRRGSLNGELIVEGKQGHAAYPSLADNPIPKLARMIERLASMTLDAGTASFEPSHLEVTVVSVPNTASNVIPAHARAVFNVRYNDLQTRAGLEALIGAHLEQAAKETSARYRLAFSGTGDVFLTAPGPLVATLRAAVAATTGAAPALSTSGGTSDARFIAAVCPVVELGLRSATAHQVDECVPLADLEALTGIYRAFLAAYFA
jgi:succinyl-diaminopimelate desuccinylase